ncbi:uncharacterized protein V6R79_001370 [Siganus canaliculatus]
MFSNNSHYGNDTGSYTESLPSVGYSSRDEVSSQASNLSRPSAKSIYLQRKNYAKSIHNVMEKYQYRVEHLMTCELDGEELRNIADCVEQLKLLEGKGRVWGQSMLLEVQGNTLQLRDIETKGELESMALSEIVELKAVMDSGVFKSLLTIKVKPRRKLVASVFLFHCDDVQADSIQRDLLQAIANRKEEPDVRNNYAKSKSVQKETPLVPPDYEDNVSESDTFVPEEDEEELHHLFNDEERPTPHALTMLDRDIDILNHILNDLEIFMGRLSANAAKNKKKKKKKQNKGKERKPTTAEYSSCLQKIKCGFNLLVDLDGKISNPSAQEFVHILFSILTFVLMHCPEGLPQTIVMPLLTADCVHMMSEQVTPGEDEIWASMGDAWNIPSNQWPQHDDRDRYLPVFSDGWQPPKVSAANALRETDPRVTDPRVTDPRVTDPRETDPRWDTPPPVVPKALDEWRLRPSLNPRKDSNLPLLRVMYDFASRNQRELTVSKGEVVELLDNSKQWWKVRNSRGEEGYVPNNILEDEEEQPFQMQFTEDAPLSRGSQPPEVKAWLEDKGFSKITVRCLSSLTGSKLLGMTMEELKLVCPEEGGRVFLQLQAVKAALAAAR